MKKSTIRRILTGFLFLSTGLAFTGCEKTPETGPQGTYARGVFVVNEGAFQASNGAITYYDPATKTAHTDIFGKENDRPLGDVVQSMAVHQEKAYIVVNNSNKVEVVDANTFASTGVIENLVMPRYFVGHLNKGYVTEWVAFGQPGRVAVVDLSSNTVTKTIAVGMSPEQIMVGHNGKIYVSNSGGASVSVINPATDVLEATLQVGDSPRNLVHDDAHNLWVLCSGKVVYNADWTVNYAQTTAGSLVQINPATRAIQTVLTFPGNQSRPGNLQSNQSGDTLYYTYAGKTYEFQTTATALPTTALIDRTFLSLGVDPVDNTLYGGTGNYAAAGEVFRYSSTGQLLDSFNADIAPNGFVFRR